MAKKILVKVRRATTPPASIAATVTPAVSSGFTTLRLPPPEKRVWDFWRDGVSSSMLQVYLACRKQMEVTYIQGYTSRYTPYAMEFGTAAHYVLEHTYRDVSSQHDIGTPEQATERSLQYVKQYTKLWFKQNPQPTEKQRKEQVKLADTLSVLLPSYWNRWDGDLTGKYTHGNNTSRPKEWVALEKCFSIPYVFPDGKRTVIRGKRDAVLADVRRRYWVLDTKCKSIVEEETIEDTLGLDLQQNLYIWAYEKETGRKCSGAIMNIVRRPGLRQKQSETDQEFLNRIGSDAADRLDHYFIRYQMEVLPDDTKHWQTTFLDPVMQEMRLWWEGKLPYYMNPNALVSKYGKCGAYELLIRNNIAPYFKRKVAHPELED